MTRTSLSPAYLHSRWRIKDHVVLNRKLFRNQFGKWLDIFKVNQMKAGHAPTYLHS